MILGLMARNNGLHLGVNGLKVRQRLASLFQRIDLLTQ